MMRYLLPCALALAACSNQPAGQSEFLDPVNIEEVEQQARLAQQRQQVITQVTPGFDAQQPVITTATAVGNDETLITSLSAAIENAGEAGQEIALGNGEVEIASPLDPVETTAPQSTAQVANGTANGTAVLPAQNSDGISDNSFSTVTASRDITTDRQRTQALAGQTVVLEAAPLPQTNNAVNLAAFARSTAHKIGERVYSRSDRSSSTAKRQCRKYPNPDAAQRAFLAAGGPKQDKLKIDPDGDGFVCGWSPVPYRNLRVGGQ